MDRTYFAETENWKHCSKISFKCVNSIVGPIFNEKVDKKWSLWDSWTVHKCTVHRRMGQPLRLKRKKKKKNWGNADVALISAIQTSTKYLSYYSLATLLKFSHLSIHLSLQMALSWLFVTFFFTFLVLLKPNLSWEKQEKPKISLSRE